MASPGPNKRVFLWTCPRSCSSAFERSILNLSTTQLISEPFQNAYYFGPQRQSPRYASEKVDQTRSYEAIAKSIMDQAPGGGIEVVFIKEMGYYMNGRRGMLGEFFHDAKHSFLIRNPKKAIPSLYRVSENPEIQGWDYFDPSEAGFKELQEMYEFVKENIDPNPVVVDADDLLSSPKEIMKAYCEGVGIKYEDHMTSWKAGEVPKAWEGEMGVAWMYQAIHSNGFLKPRDSSSSDKEVTYPADVMKAIEDSLPFYDKLYSARVRLV
ncbi:uncharacterized protein LOC144652044 [Oculina patagonica]